MSKLKSFFKRAFNSNTPVSVPPVLRFPAQIADEDCVPELIGKGTFGSVYKVTKDGKAAAVKVIECSSEEELERAKKECRIMQAVASDPHTVDYWDSLIVPTEKGHTVYILQEYLTSLEQYYSPESMTEEKIITLGIDICQAMIGCRNAGFYHLDIQPKNLFVTKDGHFKLGDFGSATYLSELDKPQPLRGTISYMAPEVYELRLYSQASDIYSLGILLYSLLNRGILPFADQISKEEAIQKRLKRAPLPRLSTGNNLLSDIVTMACSPYSAQRIELFEDLLLRLNVALKHHMPSTFPSISITAPFDVSTEVGAVPPPTVNVCPPQLFDADSFACTCALDVPPQLFDADSFASTCALSAPAPIPAPSINEVQFSAIAPETAEKGDYTMVQLYMYEQDYAYIVDDAAEEFDTSVVRKNSGIFEVEKHAKVKVILTSPDVEIIDNEAEQIWYGKYLVFDFAFELPYGFSKKQILLKAAVYINDLPVTRLMLKLKTGAAQTEKIRLERQDVTHVYMSYAREDQAKVAGLVQAIQAVRPEWEVFFDVYSLKCGSDWEQTLYKNLDV
ncbi:MAG: protein kinase, partial [Oscillospiraceae bacterium]|nr:protein kinase [Oscillospiraceae bacterium]